MNKNSGVFEKERVVRPKRSVKEKKKRQCENEKKMTGWEAMAETNMRAKTALARDLINMGLSQEAVGRILHLDEKGVGSEE
ncbi:MAG: hypothetical protein ABIF87_08165 [Pseudomonadota bacterium]